MFLLNATKSCLTLVTGEMLVAGSVNVHEVKFEFSDDWSDLVKTVTFRTVSDSRSVILNDEGECIIPWEVLKYSSPYLYVGLIGTRDAEVVLPTIWADLGEVRNGTEPGEDVTDPTPNVYEQVLSELGSRANNLNVKDEKLQLRSGETVLSEVELPKQEAAIPTTVPVIQTAQIGQTIVVKAVDESGKPTEWEAADMGGAAIIDVIELPTEDINEDVFYRLLTGTFVFNQYAQNGFTCHCVESLPEVGEPATTDMLNITGYYNVSNNDVYGYVDGNLSAASGVPVGWYTFATLAPSFNLKWGGVIIDILDDPTDDALRLLLEYVVWQCKDGEWTSLKPIGWSGKGDGAEMFNHPSNSAEGTVSHAEGSRTTASNFASHAEGEGTVASGARSHAEGEGTVASGDVSHAEGYGTTASGAHSHAEGSRTTASGDYSHAEGYETIINGMFAHVQGKYNLPDEQIGSPHVNQGKYAHIVGNGNINVRSNAHTLDWSGLGWFAGGLKVGGTGQDDENAKRVLTEDDIVQPDWNQNDESQPDYVKNRPFYEVPTNYEITWDGDMTGRTAIDLSSMWQEGVYLVKVSDRVYTKEELVGKYFTANYLQAPEKLYAYSFEDPFPGVFVESGYMLAVAYSADEFYAATGINVTNGTYFACAPSVGRYVSALYTDGRIEKLEDKFLPDTALRRVYIDIPNGDMANKLECVLDGGWSECNVTFGEGSPWGESHSNLYGKELCVPVSVRVSENSYLGHKCLFSPMYNTASVGSCYSVLNINAVGTLVQTFVRIADSGTIYVAAKTVDI